MGVAARAADQGPRGRVRHHRDPPPAVRGEPEAEHLPFAYAAYDPKDDVVVIAVGGNTPKYPVVLRHLIWHPTEVAVDADIGALKVLEKDGTTTITSFYRPPGHA